MLYRAFATVGGLTMISRLLGFARDILIAAALGSGVVADAFFVAFRFPNLFHPNLRRYYITNLITTVTDILPKRQFLYLLQSLVPKYLRRR